MAKVDETAKTTANDGWTTVSEEYETRADFDTIGDQFIGRYLKTKKIPVSGGGSFDLYIFDQVPGQDPDAKFAVSPNARLREAWAKVRPTDLVRITYVADIETKQDNPMRDFQVDVKR